MSKGAKPSYTVVVERASLESVAVRSSLFRVAPEFSEHEDTDKFIDQTVSSPHYDNESQFLIGSVRCRMWMNKVEDKATGPDRSADEAFEGGLFSVEADYIVIFRVPGDHDVATLEAFFGRMAPFACWPYFRSHVSHAAAESCLDIPILPIKKLFHPVKEAGGYRDPDDAESSVQEG